jgi:hypothetical protein
MTVTFVKNGLYFGNVSAPDMVAARKWAAAEGCTACLPSSKMASDARVASQKADFARGQEASRP